MLIPMRDAMRHRGPDDAGIWWSTDGRVGLAHRRLSIIDLTQSGHQPMADCTGQLRVIFNGEIYNYRDLRRELEGRGHQFSTASDTEVILYSYREWGSDCLSYLNGMFAFAIYDPGIRQLLLARDRAGEKPLFYCRTPDKLVFASELKALMADPEFPRRFDVQAFNHYLAYGYVPGEMCILKGVHKLGQGQAMTYNIDSGALRTWHYWQLPKPSIDSSASVRELAEELQALIRDSVRRQMVADVPVGILLSGGIDSSVITAVAAEVSPTPVRTFTISFPGHGSFDEGPHARLVAEHFGTTHTELVAEPASIELLPKLASQYDEPIGDSSMVPTYLVSRLVRQNITVALGGDGGDELFGGYLHYRWIQRLEAARRLLPAPLRRSGSYFASSMLPIGFYGRNYLTGFSGNAAWSLAHVDLYFDALTRRRLLSPVLSNELKSSSSPEMYKVALCDGRKTLLQQATAMDFVSYLVDDILTKVDRASMLTSLEVRTPLLDYRIIEFAFRRLPDALRATSSKGKVLFRCLAKALLPRTLDLNRKQGFSVPIESWLATSWGDYVESVLRETDSNLLDQKVIASLISEQRKGYHNGKRLFALTMFELWRRHYKIEPDL